MHRARPPATNIALVKSSRHDIYRYTIRSTEYIFSQDKWLIAFICSALVTPPSSVTLHYWADLYPINPNRVVPAASESSFAISLRWENVNGILYLYIFSALINDGSPKEELQRETFYQITVLDLDCPLRSHRL